MRVLVTGGAGYIGSVTVAVLLDEGHEVVVLDDLRRGHRDAVPPDARYVEGSIADPDAILDALGPGVDACIHFAAYADVGESMRAPERYFQNNTAGALVLLRTLLEQGLRRFILSSTAAVYGFPGRVPIVEEDATHPINPYGESKLLVERALAWMWRERGLRYASLRYFNAAGAHGDLVERHDPETHLIPRVLDVAAGAAEAATIYGSDYPTPDGTCVRDFVHVLDLADAHVRALESLDEHGHVVCNLGTGTGYSVAQVIDAARLVTGHPIPVEIGLPRDGDPPALVASHERARELLGWVPRYSLEEIIGSAWQSYHLVRPEAWQLA